MERPAAAVHWFRRDLRLHDNPALQAAVAGGGPVVPVFILDARFESLGAAARWRLGKGLAALAGALADRGLRLILRRGDPLAVLLDIAAETGARQVHWNRLYDPVSVATDKVVKAGLTDAHMAARGHAGHLLVEPWTIATGQGQGYRVFSPFWRALLQAHVAEPCGAPGRLIAIPKAPRSDRLEDWALDAGLMRGAAVLDRHAAPAGEAAAQRALDGFCSDGLASYAAARDRLDRPGTSALSAHLTWGEISVHRLWARAMQADAAGPGGGAAWARQLAWRDFAWHLAWAMPSIDRDNWNPSWDTFAWQGDSADAEAWRRGMTGEPVIDAAMRELYVTGTMHNRARMLVASYLCKHLLTHWRTGLDWFAQTLVDWDFAANAMGWQWVAGSGPDAAPYFRIFNPRSQAETFDAAGAYRRRWLAEGQATPSASALAWFDAVPPSWNLTPAQAYPAPLVELAAGRSRALAAYAARQGRGGGAKYLAGQGGL